MSCQCLWIVTSVDKSCKSHISDSRIALECVHSPVEISDHGRVLDANQPSRRDGVEGCSSGITLWVHRVDLIWISQMQSARDNPSRLVHSMRLKLRLFGDESMMKRHQHAAVTTDMRVQPRFTWLVLNRDWKPWPASSQPEVLLNKLSLLHMWSAFHTASEHRMRWLIMVFGSRISRCQGQTAFYIKQSGKPSSYELIQNRQS